MANSINLVDLARRVRAVRLSRRLTLEDVVSRAEFTVSWLSKLENGQLAPSLEGLVRLAKVLECGVDTLVEGLSVPPRYSVVRGGKGRVHQAGAAEGGYRVEHLVSQWRDRAMNPAIVYLSGSGNRHHPDNHDGERFLWVIEGDVAIEYGDEVIRLAPGDSIYIYAAIPHVLAPADHGTARVLSVCYDPPGIGHRTARHDGHRRPPDETPGGGRLKATSPPVRKRR